MNSLVFHAYFGYMAIIFRIQPFAIIKILLPCKTKEDLMEYINKNGWGKSGSHKKADKVKKSIIDYYNGLPIRTPWEWLDLTGLTSLQRVVLSATADVGYGRVSTYKDIAMAAGLPNAYRFVGNTLANNPFPLLIPCHRIIRSDSSTGKFRGGTELKKKLIALEVRHVNEYNLVEVI